MLRQIGVVDGIQIVYNRRISHCSFDLEMMRNSASEIPISFVADLANNYAAIDGSVGEIWDNATAGAKAVISHCLSQSHDALNEQCNNMFATALTHGFDQGNIVADAVTADNASASHIVTVIIDKLLLLAQSLAVVPYYNPEQGDWSFDGDVDRLLTKIQSKLDFDISFPRFCGGAYGVPTKFGLMTDRALMSIFIAHQISTLVRKDAAICEIGGGSGMQAYYLWQAGYRNLSIIDLPEVGLCQGYFLKRNLPKANIFLNNHFSKHRTPNGVGIYRTDRFHEASQGKWDAVLNVDSLPEMSHQIASAYVDGCASNRWELYSINQEASLGGQNIVNELCTTNGCLKSVLRFPFWMRVGYVFEYYRPLEGKGKRAAKIVRSLLRFD